MRTRILITIGDINGIGPEIILKSLSREDIAKRYDITVVTPVSVFEYYYCWKVFHGKPFAEAGFIVYLYAHADLRFATSVFFENW